MRYRYRLDGGQAYPDPCSRFQPEGPHGPSLIVDPRAYQWHDEGWPGVTMHGQVIYELHIGAFTPEGTFDAAISRLDDLKELGITVIEVMPVAEFPGRWNWGYDGVGLYAPAHVYGDEGGFKRFVDAAHRWASVTIVNIPHPDGRPASEIAAAAQGLEPAPRVATDAVAAVVDHVHSARSDESILVFGSHYLVGAILASGKKSGSDGERS